MSHIKFTTTEDLNSVTYVRISPNDSREGFLSMKKNQTDGGYILSYKFQDSITVETGGGYYTNRGSLDSWVRFGIKNDTTLVNFGDFN